jgi:hypothetical protein
MTRHPGGMQPTKSRLLSDLVRAAEAGHVLQPSAVAVLIDRNPYDIVQQAVGGAQKVDPSVEQRLQLHMRNVIAVISAAELHFGDTLQALHWFREEHAGLGSHHTPEALTAAGRLQDAFRMLPDPDKQR